jgi:hypothetical protein
LFERQQSDLSSEAPIYFQHILKGVPKIDADEVGEIFSKTGLRCNWWRRVGSITGEQIKARLNSDNLYLHLEHYHEVPSGGDRPFYEDTPFISTTAGTAVEDAAAGKLYVRDAFWEAANFATETFESNGWIFYGYVYILEKPSIELEEFAEEVRNFHLYTRFLRYRREGEITAKIEIPSVRLRCAEFYRGPKLGEQLMRGQRPEPVEVLRNDAYCPPERYANVLGQL